MTQTTSDKEWGIRDLTKAMNGTSLTNINRSEVEDFKVGRIINLGRICHNKIKDNGTTKGLTRGIINLTISTNNLLIKDLTTKDSMIQINGNKTICNQDK